MEIKDRQEKLQELEWLYMELYHDRASLEWFLQMLERNRRERKDSLRRLDEERTGQGRWYQSNRLLGMMLYVQNFGGDLQGVIRNLPYIEECGVNYLHLMPLLDSTRGKSDGGYAVSDFRKVRPDLGTMDDLEELADACHERGISLCLDFVLNHTSEDHVWAREARKGDPRAMRRYFFYDNWDIPFQFERTVPQVFPTTAPGNFTWLDDMKKVVMTTFHQYQWDLNYANPMVFNDMTDNLLYLINRGMDVIRLDAIPYIWKQLGTSCRNLPQVHTIIRMMKLACELVCPGAVLLGEVVMEPREVVPYFGPSGRPECDLLYNVTTMCTTWHTLATRDVRLLRYQMEQVCDLPDNCFFQNYLRCHDDIGWGLDYQFLEQFGFGEVPHKRYLNDWFTGKWEGSWSRGELYNDAEDLGDARLCGTTASLSGIEAGLILKDEAVLQRGIACDLMLHAWMFTQTGIPVIYSGDEIGQCNDYGYHQDPDHWADSRYLHRGKFDLELAEQRKEPGSVPQILFDSILQMQRIRSSFDVFRPDADVRVHDTGDDRILGIRRECKGQVFLGLFNFSEQTADLSIEGPSWTELMSQTEFLPRPGEEDVTVHMDGYAFFWLLKKQ